VKLLAYARVISGSKEFLISKIVAEAQHEKVLLGEVERKML